MRMLNMTTVKRLAVSSIAALMLNAAPALAGDRFGTGADLKAAAENVKAIHDDQGLGKLNELVNARSTDVTAAKIGVFIVSGGVLTSHNYYPEFAGIPLTDFIDLAGVNVGELLLGVLDGDGVSQQNWSSYDDETEYKYDCYSIWLEPQKTFYTGCR